MTIEVGDLTPHAPVVDLAFSPDEHYLAIVYSGSQIGAKVVVWDLQRNREQSRTAEMGSRGRAPDGTLLWHPSGSYITLGVADHAHNMGLWDPLTGKLIARIPMVSFVGRFNRDGSKLLTLAEQPYPDGEFRLYDTKTWAFQRFPVKNMKYGSVSWTAEDKVLASVAWHHSDVHELDGVPVKESDKLLRLIDPTGRDPSRTKVNAVNVGLFRSLNLATNQILAGNCIVDGRTLTVRRYPNTLLGQSNVQVITPDGGFLYVAGPDPLNNYRVKTLVANAATGEVVKWFEGGQRAIAISPSGAFLATAEMDAVNVFNLKDFSVNPTYR